MNRRAILSLVIGCSLPVAMALGVHDTHAQFRGAIRVWIRAIAASNAQKPADPRLQELRSQLVSRFRYASYGIASEVNRTVALRQPVRLDLRDGRILTVTPGAVDSGMIQMEIALVEGGRVSFNSNVRLTSGGTLLLGGPRYGDGVLIFAISAGIM